MHLAFERGGGIFLKFLKKTVLPSPHTQFWSMFALLPPNINSPAPRNILFANIMVIFIFLRLSRFRLHIPPPFKNHATFLTCTNLIFAAVYWVHVLCLAVLIPINISTLDCRNVVRCGIVSCDICIKRKRRAVCNLVYGHDQTIAECTKNNCNTLYINMEFFLLLSFRWWIWYSN